VGAGTDPGIERVELIDAVRGLALLGIVAAKAGGLRQLRPRRTRGDGRRS
jgi:hypothetical protein